VEKGGGVFNDNGVPVVVYYHASYSDLVVDVLQRYSFGNGA
jgi:hypothetical protein